MEKFSTFKIMRKEGESVEFDCEPGPKGLKATNVKRVGVEAPAPVQ